MSSPPTVVYIPKDFIPHAVSLRQAFAHCGRFLTAASRRSRGRVSVPVWLVVLSDQLPVIASVGRCPIDPLIVRGPTPSCFAAFFTGHAPGDYLPYYPRFP